MSGAVPDLRFPGFEGDWQTCAAGECYEFRNGLNFTKAMTGEEVRILGVGDFKSNEYFDDVESLSTIRIANKLSPKDVLQDGDILFVRSNGNKDLIGRCMYIGPLARKASYSGFTIRGRSINEGLAANFGGILFRSSRFRQYLDEKGGGTNISNLNQAILSEYDLTFPSLPEQTKIAEFLGVVDAKLAALRRKKGGLEAFKSGLMQQLFTQTLRFTRDDGTDFPDWEEKTLEEIGERPKTKNVSSEISRVLTNSAVSGVIDQGDYFDREIANADNISGYYIVRFGDFVYNPRISVTAPVGPIKRNLLADGIMSPLYTVFRINDGSVEFFSQYFLSDFWHDYMKGVANYGARHDRMAISNADFMLMPLPWPHPDEQRKIADALSALDAKISAVGEQIAQMQTFKQGLLQQMFV